MFGEPDQMRTEGLPWVTSFNLKPSCAVPAFADRQWLTPQDFEARVAGRAMKIFEKSGDLFAVDYF